MMAGEPLHNDREDVEHRYRCVIGTFCNKEKQGGTELQRDRHHSGGSVVLSRHVHD